MECVMMCVMPYHVMSLLRLRFYIVTHIYIVYTCMNRHYIHVYMYVDICIHIYLTHTLQKPVTSHGRVQGGEES